MYKNFMIEVGDAEAGAHSRGAERQLREHEWAAAAAGPASIIKFFTLL
jgi:hypothetical protein